MSYLHHASKHISSSHSLSGSKKPVGFLLIIVTLIILVVLYFVLGSFIGNILFGIKSLFVPNTNGQISLLPSAYDSKIQALEVENDALLQLIKKAGVRIPSGIATDPMALEKVNQDTGEESPAQATALSVASTTATSTKSSLATSTLSPQMTTGAGRIAAVDNTLRKDEVLASVLVRPPQSPYDALVVNVGSADGVTLGDQVYAFRGFPIGEVVDVKEHRTTVKLLSAPGSKIDVLIGTTTMAFTAEGKGGGNFFLKLPKVTEIHKGDLVARNFLKPEVFSAIESVDSEDGEAYIYAYFKLPINLNSLIYVLIKKSTN